MSKQRTLHPALTSNGISLKALKMQQTILSFTATQRHRVLTRTEDVMWCHLVNILKQVHHKLQIKDP